MFEVWYAVYDYSEKVWNCQFCGKSDRFDPYSSYDYALETARYNNFYGIKPD